jgi:NDP-sugar pyrophosphorylase family protein
LLDTGGGLKKAAWFFLGEGPEAPFILHNVDVISEIDLRRMLASHARNQALATLAVQRRQTSRYLLFDKQMRLCGRRLVEERKTELVAPSPRLQELAFSGIHVISTRLLEMMREEGAFSIIQAYLRLAGEGESIVAYRADGDYWRDLGTPESIARASEDLKKQAAPRGVDAHYISPPRPRRSSSPRTPYGGHQQHKAGLATIRPPTVPQPPHDQLQRTAASV